MICPRCAGEFVDGVLLCPDCAVKLVNESAALAEPKAIGDDLIAVATVTDVSLIPLIESLMARAGIPFLIQGEHAVGMIADVRVAGWTRPGMVGAHLLVPARRRHEAEGLLRSHSSDVKSNENKKSR